VYSTISKKWHTCTPQYPKKYIGTNTPQYPKKYIHVLHNIQESTDMYSTISYKLYLYVHVPTSQYNRKHTHQKKIIFKNLFARTWVYCTCMFGCLNENSSFLIKSLGPSGSTLHRFRFRIGQIKPKQLLSFSNLKDSGIWSAFIKRFLSLIQLGNQLKGTDSQKSINRSSF